MVDLEGNVAAAVSSGGLAMKHPGRVGQVVFPFLISGYVLIHIKTYINNVSLYNSSKD